MKPLSISPSSNLHFRGNKMTLPPAAKHSRSLAFLNRTTASPFRFDKVIVNAVRYDGPVIEIKELEGHVDNTECELVIQTCITRTLTPALTLEHGLKSVKEAVEELKLNPPASSTGIFRFQVAVPPGPKALTWFCCQPQSSGVFPIFFLSKEIENPSIKSLYLNRTRGVFGIGAAIYFVDSSSRDSGEQKMIRRYVLSDSVGIGTYGFKDAKFDPASTMKHEAGSFYLVIPEIELDEHEDVSILSATLAWDDVSFCTFKQAIQSFESSIYQASAHFWSATDRSLSYCIRAALSNVNLVKEDTFRMVSSRSLILDRRGYQDDLSELVSSFS